jgi:hypothetical protein
MVVRYVTKNGGVMMGPPYTDEEKQDLYRRIASGPWTMLRTAKTPRTADPGAASTNRQTRRRANRLRTLFRRKPRSNEAD